jgi:hypothetical protein
MRPLLIAVAVLAAVALLGAVAASGAPADPTHLPLGDGLKSAKPTAGRLFACQKRFVAAPAAERNEPWIGTDGTWDQTKKVVVAGDVAAPKTATYSAKLTKNRKRRTVASRDLPVGTHTGVFPIAASDPAHQYNADSHAIARNDVSLSLPSAPKMLHRGACLGTGAIGILKDGVLLFDGLDPYGLDAPARSMLDRCGGHPDARGVYHRHQVPDCLISKAKGRSTLVGYALDGYGIYVERDASGGLLTNADLDACHGRRSAVKWDGKTRTMYHYVATAEFPYTLGCFRAKAVESDLPLAGAGSGGAAYSPNP